MYFIFAKIFGIVVVPSNLIIFAFVLSGFFAFFRFRLFASVLFLIGISALLLGVISNLPSRALEKLEAVFPRCHDNPTVLDGIVVLGGATSIVPSKIWDRLIVNDAGNRLIVMADFARRYPDAKIVFAGGYGSMFGTPMSEADIIAKHISVLGLSPDRVMFERKSRNTIENAAYTKEIIDPKPDEKWLLVTSAYHMPRAYGMFRKLGFPVEACASDYQTAPGYDEFTLNFDVGERLRILNLVTREYLALFAALLFGYTDEFLPGPSAASTGQ